MIRTTRDLRRRWLIPLPVVLAALLVSPHLGRAAPTGNYRPVLPADALTSACYPVPAGLTLDFPYQVRSDGDVGQGARRHRRLVIQYDQLDLADVRTRLDTALRRAGLPPDAATLTAYPRIPDDAVVRGQIVLRLPVTKQSSDAPDPAQCANPFSTKRFPPSWPPSDSYA